MTQQSRSASTPTGPLASALGWGVFASALLLGDLRAGATPPGEVLAQARSAFAQGASELAAGVLDGLLSGGDLPTGVREEAWLLRAKILLQKGDSAQVERLLSGREGEPEAALLLAQAALLEERWAPAVERFGTALKQGADALGCALGGATALARLGREREAIAQLRRFSEAGTSPGQNPLSLALAGLLLDVGSAPDARAEISKVQPTTPQQSAVLVLLEARLALSEGRLAEASTGFGSLMHPAVPAPPEVLAGAWLGEASVLEAKGEPAAAAKLLLQFLKTGRDLPCAEPLFSKAAQLLSEVVDPSVADFETCTRTGPPNQRALAAFYLAQFYSLTGRTDRAAAAHAAFCEQFQHHRLLPVSLLQRAEILMGSDKWAEALALLKEALRVCEEPGLRAALQMRQGLALMRTGDFGRALAVFEGIGRAGAELRVEAGFNAGLAAIRLGDLKKAAAQREALNTLPGTQELVASLELETALFRAAGGLAQGHEALQAFMQHHPGHPRTGDAKVALAELLLREAESAAGADRALAASAMRERASGLLKAVAVDPQSPQSAMHAKFLAVFLTDSGGGAQPEEVLNLGEAFLREYPEAVLSNEMRMKLGEVYFRRKDYANAEEQFAGIASRQPEGALSETALFLAGQCAASRLNPGSVDEALRYWERVAQGNGSLRWRARYQQAAVKSRIGEEADGAELFERIVNSPEAIDVELRLAARCGRADAMLSLARRGVVPLAEVLAEYEALAVHSEVTPVWRNQALHKKAKALEATQQQEALEGFYRVLEAPDSVAAGEFFWLFKAGFDAARILEGRQAWRDCVALYERLGRLGGPRSQEAKNRAFQIRLERFLWE
jgi:tetratricopeptide (TPR) repeat protein